jgi:hypothetical protein
MDVESDFTYNISITQVPVPDNLHRLVFGKTLEGEQYGNGFELYLDSKSLEKLKNVLEGYLAL